MTQPMINYATRARLGVLVPSGNTVAEPELRAMLPAGVGLFVTRLPLTGSSETELLAMLETLEAGTRLLADARPDAIAFHCTAVSTFAPHMAGEIRSRMGRASAGKPKVSGRTYRLRWKDSARNV